MGTLVDILKSSPNIKVEVTAKDLLEFADEIVARVRREIHTEPEEGFYSIGDVMRIYKIKARSTLYKWDKSGYLPCEKAGSRVQYQKGLVHKVLGSPKFLEIR